MGSLLHAVCLPEDGEDTVQESEILEDDGTTTWKEPGSLNDCMEQSSLWYGQEVSIDYINAQELGLFYGYT